MFQLVFRGECVEGTDQQAARDNARALFKASVEQVDKMFSGQPVVIRNRLEEAQAEKYRAVLYKHGMIAYVQPMAGAGAEAGAEAGAAARQPASPPREKAGPAPSEQPPVPDDASQPAARQGEAPKVEPGDRLPVAGEKVDSILAGSGLTLDPVGVTLEEHEEAQPPMFQHLDEWSLAPAGSDLGVKRDIPPPVVPDVSHLSLAEEENRESDA